MKLADMRMPSLREVSGEAKLLLIGIPVFLWTMLPIYHLFLFSISPKDSAFSGKLWPDHPTFRNFEFVIPCEGSVVYPYVIGLVKNAPDKDKAKKVLDYLLSDKGQAIWTNAYLRPARPIELPEAIKKKFLPDSDYARAKAVDWGEMENVQKSFVDRYLAEVR